MKARLNLTIDESLLANVKRVAEKKGTSVSELVEEFFRKFTKKKKKKSVVDIIRKLDKPAIDPEVDLKELYYKEQGGKYGF